MPAANTASDEKRRHHTKASAGPSRKRLVDGLIPIAAPAAAPAASASTSCGVSSKRTRLQKYAETTRGDHRREVRQPCQSERLREQQLGVPLVIAEVRERDTDEGKGDPQDDGPIAEHASPDPRSDPVEGEHRHRQQDDDVEDDDRGQCRDEIRSGDACDRCEHRRPAVPDQRVAQLTVPEQPAKRVVPELIATLVVDPAAVPHRPCEREARRPTRPPRARRAPREREALSIQSTARTMPARPRSNQIRGLASVGACALTMPPRAASSDTRRSCARARRATTFEPRNRTAPAHA